MSNQQRVCRGRLRVHEAGSCQARRLRAHPNQQVCLRINSLPHSRPDIRSASRYLVIQASRKLEGCSMPLVASFLEITRPKTMMQKTLSNLAIHVWLA